MPDRMSGRGHGSGVVALGLRERLQLPDRAIHPAVGFVVTLTRISFLRWPTRLREPDGYHWEFANLRLSLRRGIGTSLMGSAAAWLESYYGQSKIRVCRRLSVGLPYILSKRRHAFKFRLNSGRDQVGRWSVTFTFLAMPPGETSLSLVLALASYSSTGSESTPAQPTSSDCSASAARC